MFAFRAQTLLEELEKDVASCREMHRRASLSVRILDYRGVLSLVEDITALAARPDGSRFFLNMVPLAGLEAHQELDIVDLGVADITFFFLPARDEHISEREEYSDYHFLPLRPERSVLQVAFDHPAATRGKISLEEAAALTLVGTSASLYTTSNGSQIEKLMLSGRDISLTNSLQGSKDRLVKTDHRYAGVIFEPSDHVKAHTLGDFAYVEIEDFDFSVQPYAVCRKDNPNPEVHKFMRQWGELLEQELRRADNGRALP